MTRCPCVDCQNKGCGSYHDKCEPYKEFKAEVEKTSLNKLKYNEINAPIGKVRPRKSR